MLLLFLNTLFSRTALWSLSGLMWYAGLLIWPYIFYGLTTFPSCSFCYSSCIYSLTCGVALFKLKTVASDLKPTWSSKKSFSSSKVMHWSADVSILLMIENNSLSVKNKELRLKKESRFILSSLPSFYRSTVLNTDRGL